MRGSVSSAAASSSADDSIDALTRGDEVQCKRKSYNNRQQRVDHSNTTQPLNGDKELSVMRPFRETVRFQILTLLCAVAR